MNGEDDMQRVAKEWSMVLSWLGVLAVLAGCQNDVFHPPLRAVPNSESPASNLGGVGDACQDALRCRPPLACSEDDGTCQPTGMVAEGDACLLTADCAEGLLCAPTEGVCARAGQTAEGAACGDTSECVAGLICTPNGFTGMCVPAGEGDIGASCDTAADCLAGLGCNPPADDPAGERFCAAGVLGLPPVFSGPDCVVDDEGAFRSYFEVPQGEVGEFYRLPYPNDIRLRDGHPDLSGHPTPGPGLVGFDIVQTYIDAIESSQRNFGPNQAVYFRFSSSLDFESINLQGDDRNLYIIDITQESPRYNRRTSLNWQGSTARGAYICQNWIAVRSAWGDPLRPNSTYAVVLLDSIQNEEGENLARDSDFEAMLVNPDPGGVLSEAWAAYAPLRHWLSREQIDASPIASVAVFTTGDPWSVTRELPAAATADSPTVGDWTLCDDQIASPCDDGLQDAEHVRGCFTASASFDELHTKISLPIFQQGDAPYLNAGGAIATENGVPSLQGREDVCMSVTVPKTSAPPNGWPVVIYAHGTGGNFRGQAAQLGELLSGIDIDGQSVGFLTVGWDQVQHFDRRGGDETHPNELVFNYANPDAAMGNFLQAAAEVHAVTAWAKSWSLAASESPTAAEIKIDPDQIYFIGHSQGGTSVPLALGFNSDIQGAVLSGAGAGLAFALLGKQSPVHVLNALKLCLLEPRVGINHPVLNHLQGFFAPVDPLNYAASLSAYPVADQTTPHHIFHLNGLGDTYSPNTGLDLMARALRSTYVAPLAEEVSGLMSEEGPISGNVTHGDESFTLVGSQVAPADYDGHFVLFRDQGAREDVATFLATGVLNGVPEIR
jgi:hypothetical protein